VAYVNHSLVVPVNRDRMLPRNGCGRYQQLGIAPDTWHDREMGRTYRHRGSNGGGLYFLPTIGPSVPTRHVYRPLALLRLLRHLEPRILHAELEPYSLGAWQLVAVSRLLGLPLILSTWANCLTPKRAAIARPVLALCSAMVAGTPQIAATWRELAGELAVIPLGYEGSRFSPPADDRRPGRPARVGYLGRLVHGKGVDVLVRAAAIGGSWRLLIDDGPGRERIEALAAGLGIEDRVRFHRIEYEEVPDFLRTLDLLVLPSRTTPGWREQFGRVLVEAMATGTPVIGSSSGSIPWVIGDAGLVFREEHAGELAACIGRVLGDLDLWRELRARGLERAREFSWRSVGERTARVYDEVLRRS
jgi:glycosyltransferase involved in cell wall biosynthesis